MIRADLLVSATLYGYDAQESAHSFSDGNSFDLMNLMRSGKSRKLRKEVVFLFKGKMLDKDVRPVTLSQGVTADYESERKNLNDSGIFYRRTHLSICSSYFATNP